MKVGKDILVRKASRCIPVDHGGYLSGMMAIRLLENL
jgi:hypothetical protein